MLWPHLYAPDWTKLIDTDEHLEPCHPVAVYRVANTATLDFRKERLTFNLMNKCISVGTVPDLFRD